MRNVVTAFAVLEKLAETHPADAAELAHRLGLPEPAVENSLLALAEVGWIRPEEEPGEPGEPVRWVLTGRPLVVGGHVVRREVLPRAAATVMQELAAHTGETVHLTIPDGDWMVLIDKVESRHETRNPAWIGGRAPMHASAAGLAVLAHLPAVRLETLSLDRFTGFTLTDRDVLKATLSEVRIRGYAVNPGMWRSDLNGVASAILDAAGTPVAAIGVSTVAARLPRTLWPQYGALTRDAATRITKRALREP
ncbi:IclR family transcriptional regulator [Bailinhaonella thermotolerans]|uniref:IclR family transcriptional regulator n=1 Tax=Bailinhaonella thermotolerans TaxID=1070861 RepID=A0A3A4AQG9_9ACTN|nr:IclR family transcriptional regulator [Bailinhaonella thermotolerans]RJL21721.1 IclR family transcriptional regulator [Bailinhaonella thermotolerans]